MAAEGPLSVKDLASSDRKLRTKNLERITNDLRTRNDLTLTQSLQLWKGFYFCLWMTDPAMNRAIPLINTLTSILSYTPTSNLVPFIAAFWQTMIREWHSIDRLRLDKYLTLIRSFINETFARLARDSWSDTDLIKEHSEILATGPLDPLDRKVPDGLRFHILDVFVDELQKVDRDEEAPLDMLLSPVVTVKEKGLSKELKRRAGEVLGDERIQAWRKDQDSG